MYIVAVIQLNYTVFIKPRSNQIIINIFCTHNVTVVVYIFIYFIAAGTIAAIGCKWNKFPPPPKKKLLIWHLFSLMLYEMPNSYVVNQ